MHWEGTREPSLSLHWDSMGSRKEGIWSSASMESSEQQWAGDEHRIPRDSVQCKVRPYPLSLDVGCFATHPPICMHVCVLQYTLWSMFYAITPLWGYLHLCILKNHRRVWVGRDL